MRPRKGAGARKLPKDLPKKMSNETIIITEYNKGVRCGHCGDRSKVGETWIAPEKSWIGDKAICYGHKKCVEEAIAIALLKQPSHSDCPPTSKEKTTPVIEPETAVKKGEVASQHPAISMKVAVDDCDISVEKPPATKFTKELRALLDRPDDESCKDESYRKDLENLVRLACERFDKAEAENKEHGAMKRLRDKFIYEQAQRIKELEAGQLDFAKETSRILKTKIQRITELAAENKRHQKNVNCIDSLCNSMDEFGEPHKEEKWPFLSERVHSIICDLLTEIKEFEALRDTVQISCNPPDDCNDPVVLKKYMKGCFDEAMKL
ncbi:hypothetical protein LCGC14_1134240 [marine sediment metagenome]|uniref:Uncharacterized protein n=1 Tax=marine sediment metagenome TaxID=412755 RepID=A0A0F9M561_9ZZZZ|nr:hypothetical protein [Candidatus Aminicenantes bacterium]